MTDDYTREALRDAIPLLEQLLERLKIITTDCVTAHFTPEQIKQLQEAQRNSPPPTIVDLPRCQ